MAETTTNPRYTRVDQDSAAPEANPAGAAGPGPAGTGGPAPTHYTRSLAKKALRAAARHPAEFAPLAGAGTALAAGMVDADVQGAWPYVWSAVILAGCVLYARSRTNRDRGHAHSIIRRAYHAAAYAATLIYVAAAQISGPDDPKVTEFFTSCALGATLLWWGRHTPHAWDRYAPRYLRRNKPPAPPRTLETDPLEKLGGEIRGWWERKVTTLDGLLPRAEILDLSVNEYCARLHVQLDPDFQTFTGVARLQRRIAAQRGLAATRVVITEDLSEREDQAVITLFHRDPTAAMVPFPGPTIDVTTGCAVLGTTQHGQPALIRFWEPGSGAWHEVVCGASGSGKSRLLDAALINERHALDEQGRHLVVSWIGDPQEGQSLPNWQKQVDRFARNLDEIRAMLELALVELRDRNRYLSSVEWTDEAGQARTGKDHFVPSADMPLLSITLEEAPEILADKRSKAIVLKILKLGRKCGVRVRLVCQIPSIQELGQSFSLRSLLASMCVICLRTTTPIAKSAFPSLPGDPSKLKEFFPDNTRTVGLGYITGAVHPAKFRTFTVEGTEVHRLATAGQTAHLTPMTPVTVSDPADIQDVLDELTKAEPVDEQDAEQAAAAQAATAALAEDFQRLAADPHHQVDRSVAPGPNERLLTAGHRVLAYLASREDGQATSGVLVHELGLNNPTVSESCKAMVKAGLLVKVKHGLYRLPTVAERRQAGAERPVSVA